MNSNIFTNQDVCKVSLKLLSPACIGDGTKLNAKEYLYDPQERQVYFLNHVLWHKFIYEKQWLADYEKFLCGIQDDKRKAEEYNSLARNSKKTYSVGSKNNLKDNSLFDWLKAKGCDIKDLEAKNIIKAASGAEVNSIASQDKKTLNDIVTHIKTVEGKIYIPGSSLKGALKTAVLYHLFKKKSHLKEKWWEHLRQSILNRTFKIYKPKEDADIDRDFLCTLEFDGETNASLKNAMRGISCSDGYSRADVATAILQKVDVSFYRKENRFTARTLPISRECVLPASEFIFDLKIDKAMTGELDINSIEDLLKSISDFFDFTDTIYKDAFKQEYAGMVPPDANIYIGSGTGFLTKTLLAALAPSPSDAVNLIKIILDQSFKNAKHMYDKNISPRTLKCTTYKGKRYLMGVGVLKKHE